MPPLVFIVIVNFNGHEDTIGCLSTLPRLRYERFQVVVDNGSPEASRRAPREAFPDLDPLENTGNQGVSAGKRQLHVFLRLHQWRECYGLCRGWWDGWRGRTRRGWRPAPEQ